ncbi:MAG: ribosomal L7Ae/L30e/S12e/Gadd45 family protein [Acutalibacteraceae bacterium]|nr:ribosomal L7Ae/L30e/S12e/Gadd45 family protein [Acutalibacteraceae bacterium]
MNNKILSLLGFAAKARSLSYGFEASVATMKASKAYLVLVAEDISPKSRKEIAFFADKNAVKHITLKGIDIKTVSDAVGRKCGIISVNEKGFANACEKALIEGGIANDQ